MKQFLLTGALIALSVSILGAQKEENVPTEIASVTLSGVKVRYLDFKWDEEAFEALEQGANTYGAQRSWAIARLYPTKPIILDGRQVLAGNLLILNPAQGDKPMTLEIRIIDMREVFKDANIIAEPPEGRTIYVGPANFQKVDTLVERLKISLSEGDGTMTLSIHYGNRLARMVFKR